MRSIETALAFVVRVAALFLLGGSVVYGGYTFTTVDDPSAQFYPATFAQGLNNAGVIVGSYSTSEFVDTGFEDEGGVFSNISETDPTTKNTDVSGINDSGTVVGSYQNFFGNYGFVDSGGTFTQINDGVFGTYASGINDLGQIVGYSYNATSYSGFLDTGGTFTAVNDPNAGAGYGQGTYPSGINTAGVIVGHYVDSSGDTHGFLDVGGVFTTIDDPDANYGTYVESINDAGQIVGYYVDNLGVGGLAYHGFLYDSGTFTEIDDPDAISQGGTQVFGINNDGEIVGYYTCSTCGDNYQGFSAEPEGVSGTPEPSTFALILTGMVMIKFLHRGHGCKQPRSQARPGGD